MNASQIQDSQKSSTLIASLQSFSRQASVAVVLIGSVVILGWIFDITVLKSVVPGLVTMKANTAICFIFAGASLWLWHSSAKTRDTAIACSLFKGATHLSQRLRFLWRRFPLVSSVGQVCALLVFLISLLTLIQYGFNVDLGIDQLLFEESQTVVGIPGRMTPNTALTFLLLSSSLLLLSLPHRTEIWLERFHRISQFVASVAFLIALLGLLGYIYGNAYFYRVGSSTAMALHTALAFLLLSLGILFARPERGVMAIVTCNNAGGFVAQRILPLAIAIPPIACWLILLGERSQVYTSEMAICLLSILNVVIFAILTWWNAHFLNRRDRCRSRAEKALQRTLEELEQRVEQRTTELKQTNEQVAREIIERQQTEVARQQSEERFRVALHNSPTVVFNQDTELRYTWLYNAPVELRSETFLGKLDAEIFPLEEAQQLTAIKRRVLESGVGTREEVLVTTGENASYYDLTVEPLRNLSGEIVGVTCTATDISRNKQAEAEIRRLNEILERRARESETRYQQIVELSEQGIWVVDARGQTIYVNQALTRMLGYSESEILGRPISDTIVAIEQSKCCSPIDFNNLRRVKQCELTLKLASGKELWVDLSASAARNENGNTLWSCILIYDLSDRKQAEEQLRQSSERVSLANAELTRATRLKDEFLANMSHELRTPLNAILGLSEVLQEEVYGELTDKQRKSVTTIEQSGRHLLELINDILDLSKIESGKVELEIAAVAVESLCESSLMFVKQQAQSKFIKLRSQIDEGIGDIDVDERRIRQVLVNLLSNAVKFTPENGEVRLVAEADRESETLKLSVIDTGIGIARENLDKLFKPFVQVDSSLSRRYQGTGLGLSLVRRIVELHGGSISLTSDLGKGSCFTVNLPWQERGLGTGDQGDEGDKEDKETRGQGGIFPNPKPQALIVEDSEPAAKQITRYLGELGVRATTHPLGEGTVQATLNSKPDVIILDILLPDLSGWEVLAQLKANAATRDIPVLVVSVLDERSRALELGASDYLLKPFSRQQLQSALSKILPASSPSPDRAALVVTPDAPAKLPSGLLPLVLLAEDNEGNIATVMDYLQHQGVRVSLARNGIEAVEMAHQLHPNLILMDIQMPEMDGLEAIRRIRAQPELASIPIIALTALAMPGDRERCLAIGATDYLTKPVGLKTLSLAIAQYTNSLANG